MMVLLSRTIVEMTKIVAYCSFGVVVRCRRRSSAWTVALTKVGFEMS